MAETENTGQHLLKEKDFVDVVDEDGKDLGYQVPKHWSRDQLPAGAKKKSKSSSSSSSTPPARKPGEEPKGNASTDEWVAYAKAKGAGDEDLKDEQGEPLGQKALREKYGAPAT